MLNNYKVKCARPLLVGVAGLLLVTSHMALAAVSPADAERLKNELTPLGAERAGNAAGTIPAWTGGYTEDGIVSNQPRPELFADDKPLFSITAQNMSEHADKLTDGTKAMFEKYPQTYRIDVYETHRTAAAPEWVYDNTFDNATSAKLVQDVDGGMRPAGAYGGIPFPIPQNGEEAIWNHLVSWKGVAAKRRFHGVLGTSSGDHVLTVDAVAEEQYPYYFPESSAEAHSGEIYNIRLRNEGPPIRAGEGITGGNTWGVSEAYVYLTGQRRTRRLPESCCDTPTPATAGVQSFDELSVFSGTTKRFDWEILGKKEMYIPSNTNKLLLAKSDDELMAEHHLNPDHIRWELHRVWVVEAKVKDGQRHQAPRSIYYIDEDNWNAVLGDRWDQQGNLWKTVWGLPYVRPDLPGTMVMSSGFYDLVSGAWYANGLYNETEEKYMEVEQYPSRIFTASGLKARGLR